MNVNPLDRILPNSVTAEQSVLGSMLLEAGTAGLLAREKLKAEDFYYANHTTIYRTVAEMMDKGEAVDMITLTNRLVSEKKLEEVGGAGFLAELIRQTPTTANVAEYIGIMQEKKLLRDAIALGHELINSAFDQQLEPSELVGSVSSRMTQLCQSKTAGAVKADVLMKRVMVGLEERWQSKREFQGIATGIDDLDGLLRGLRPAEIIIIAGYPGVGKSVLANNISDNVAKQGKRVMVHNVEMLGEEQMERSLAAESSVDLSHYQPSLSYEESLVNIRDASARLGRLTKWISDGAGRTAAQIVAETRRFQQQNGLDMVVVDFLQDIKWPHRCDNENAALTQSMNELKAGAMVTKVPWIILSQLNRDAANNNRRPRMQDLRGSGSLEQSAHKICLMSNMTESDRKILPENMQGIQAEELAKLVMINAAKVRGGQVGNIMLKFEKKFNRFDDLKND